jgi:uncharacterized membrane protein (UPF0127 family)
MKRSATLLVLVAFMIFGCGGSDGVFSSGQEESGGGSATESSPSTRDSEDGLRTVVVNASSDEQVEVRVEIADDSAEQAQGLMNRTSLGENRGMLFVFEEEATLSFWMRNTLIPLSVAYIDSEGRIVDIQKMEPLDDEPPQYVSAEPAQYALEVNQGFFEERGVEVGDTAELPV